MNFFRLFILFGIYWGFGSSIAHALTLDEVLEAVVQNHPAIGAAQFNAQVSQEMKKGVGLPDPQMGVTFTEVPSSNSSLGNARMTDYWLSQEIPFPGTLVAQSKSLKAKTQANRAQITSQTRAVIFEASQTYFELIADRAKLSSKQKILGLTTKISKSIGTSYQNSFQGTGSPTDAAMAQLKNAEVTADIHDLHHQIAALEAKLALMMGRDPSKPIGPLASPPIKKIRESAENLLAKMATQNSDLSSARFFVEQARHEKTVASLGKIPTLEPSFAYNRRQNEANAATIGIGLNLPLWFNKNAAATNAAKAEVARSRKELENATLTAKEDFYYLYNHAIQHAKIITLYKNQIVPLAEKGIGLSWEEFKNNRSTPSMIFQKITEFEDASINYWDMWSDYQTEFSALEKLTGEKL